MFRQLSDFDATWAYETDATLKVFRELTADALAQAVMPGGRTLGRMAWHITVSLFEMLRHAGIPASGPDESAPQPSLDEIVHTYERGAQEVRDLVHAHWSDALLLDYIPIYGEQWTRGQTLAALIAHQTHHRAQMTVLMRQAGLKVPGVYGPAKEEWGALGLPVQP